MRGEFKHPIRVIVGIFVGIALLEWAVYYFKLFTP